MSLAYARAVGEMQRRATSDPTSWAWQAAMHGTYAQPPRGARWNQCQHASWFFLPWHRMYLYWFERIVRATVVSQGGPGNWALPYWNYSRGLPSNTLPPAFRQPTLPDGSTNPLFVAQRSPGINAGAQLPPRATSTAVAESFTNFIPAPSPGFGGGRSPAMQFENATGALENQPHNIIHGLVGGPGAPRCGGGLMSDPMCAARDPIFWLHHANIDRLWSRWIGLGGGRANPTDRAWLGERFTFYDEKGAQVTMTAADILDTVRQLGYRYDDQPPAARRAAAAAQPPVAAAAAAANPEREPELLAASEGGIELGGDATTVSVVMPPQSRPALAMAADASTEDRLRLDVEGVEVDEDPGIVYEVYINLPADRSDEEAEESHFVGHVTFFGAKRLPDDSEHGREGGLRHTFDITPVVQELRERGVWDEEKVEITFVPLGLIPPPGEEGDEVRARMAAPPGPDPRARIGRVRIVRE